MPDRVTEEQPPLWFRLQARIDYYLWMLSEISNELAKPRSPINAMIDNATGETAAMEKQANKIMRRVNKLKQIWEREITCPSA